MDLDVKSERPALETPPLDINRSISDKIKFMKMKLNGQNPEDVMKREFLQKQRDISDKLIRVIGTSTATLDELSNTLEGLSDDTAQLDWDQSATLETNHLKTSLAELSDVNQRLAATLLATQTQLTEQKKQKATSQQSLDQLSKTLKSPSSEYQGFIDEAGNKLSIYIAKHTNSEKR